MIDVKHLSKSFGEVEVLKRYKRNYRQGRKRSLSSDRQAQENPPFSAVLTLWKKPSSGDIFFEGENITQANEHENEQAQTENGHGFSAFQPLPTSYNKKRISLLPL